LSVLKDVQAAPDPAEVEELQACFEQEIDRIASSALVDNAVEGVMRLRALAEIASALDTETLLALASKVEAVRRIRD
jgi:hypothetical protein